LLFVLPQQPMANPVTDGQPINILLSRAPCWASCSMLSRLEIGLDRAFHLSQRSCRYRMLTAVQTGLCDSNLILQWLATSRAVLHAAADTKCLLTVLLL
jgi:hypothetical protein